MSDQDLNVPLPEERIMAALAHITILVPLMGVIAPIVIWITQKEKSRYVAFQALQATVFQLVLVLTWFIGMACYTVTIFFAVFMAEGFLSSNPPGEPISGPAQAFGTLGVLIPFLVIGLVILAGLAAVIYGVVAAIQTLRGTAFRYAIIGDRVERFLQQGKPAEGQTVDNVP